MNVRIISPTQAPAHKFTNKYGQVRQHRRYYEEEPQGFEVTVFPGEDIYPHYHTENQFQLFFPTAGATYARKPIDHVAVHYAEAYTVYGPIEAASEESLHFMTLRAHVNHFTGFMPGAEAERVRRGAPSVHVDVLDRPATSDIENLMGPREDGLWSCAIRCQPGEIIPDFGPAQGDGQFVAVIGGSIDQGPGADQYEERSLAWVPVGSQFSGWRAGDAGASLVVMQFPAASDEAAS